MSWFFLTSMRCHKTRKRPFAALAATLSQAFALAAFIAPSSPANAGKGILPPAPVTTGKSYFYASRRACASSGQFSPEDCDVAFERVDALLRERAPKFSEKYECILQFKLCDKDAETYLPAVLGVEIIKSKKGLSALPMLAVETPAEILRDPDPPPPERGLAAEAASQPQRSGNGAHSPYGALALEAMNLVPAAPPSIKSYHQYIDQVQLRMAVIQQGAKADPSWRAER